MATVQRYLPTFEEGSAASLRRAFLGSFALHATAGIWFLLHALNASNPLLLPPLEVRLVAVPVPIETAPRRLPTPNPVEQNQPVALHPNTARKAQPQLTRLPTEESSSSSFSVPAQTEPSQTSLSSRTVSSASLPQFSAAYLNNPAPEYPAVARRRRQQGTTLLDVRVSTGGRPISVEIGRSSGVTSLDEAARDAVRGWTFVPAKVGDNPVEGRVEVPIRFHLND